MMVSNPEQWVTDMAEAGADQFTFHLESTKNPLALIAQIKAAKMKVGVALKPGTPVEQVLPLAQLVDMVLIMTVEPGFGGQKFMTHMMPKVKTLRTMFPLLDIEVDGGVSPSTIGNFSLLYFLLHLFLLLVCSFFFSFFLFFSPVFSSVYFCGFFPKSSNMLCVWCVSMV